MSMKSEISDINFKNAYLTLFQLCRVSRTNCKKWKQYFEVCFDWFLNRDLFSKSFKTLWDSKFHKSNEISYNKSIQTLEACVISCRSPKILQWTKDRKRLYSKTIALCILFCIVCSVHWKSNILWNMPKFGVFSGLYFPVFGLNTEFYPVNLRILPKY